MRKIIQQQLEKVEYADLSNLKEGEPFIIPKRSKDNIELGIECIIELKDDLLIKGKNEILESNYNHGKVPPSKYLHGEAVSNLGKLVLFTGYAYDDKDLNIFWRGYLPKDKIKVIKKVTII